MNYAEICIIKRDGKREDFSISKIKNAVTKAFSATGINDEQQLIADITMNVIGQFASPTITVEEIQDLVEKELMKVRPEVAKSTSSIGNGETPNETKDPDEACDGRYRSYRQERCQPEQCQYEQSYPAGQMMTFASEVTKDYTYKYLLPKRFAEAHQLGDIHIHDLDYYPTKPRLASSMTWMTSSNVDSAPRTAVYVLRKAFKAMLPWLPLFSRLTRTNSTEVRPYRHSTSLWQRGKQIIP